MFLDIIRPSQSQIQYRWCIVLGGSGRQYGNGRRRGVVSGNKPNDGRVR